MTSRALCFLIDLAAYMAFLGTMYAAFVVIAALLGVL